MLEKRWKFIVMIMIIFLSFGCLKDQDTEGKQKNSQKVKVEKKLTDETEKEEELSFSEQVLKFCKNKNAQKLKKLLLPLKKDKPVFDELFGTEEGKKYYSLGKIIEKFYIAKDIDTLCFLLENGASGFIETGDAPIVSSYLKSSIENNDVKSLARLLKAGAKRNAYSCLGNVDPDLYIAIKNKSYDCMEFLLKNGADPNYKKKTVYIGEPGGETTSLLFYAKDDPKALKLLFKYGAKEGVIRERTDESGKKFTTILKRKGNKFIVTE